MKLVEIAKRGSGRVVKLQITMSELISIVAMFEVVIKDYQVGHVKEKKMKSRLRNILAIAEDVIAKNEYYVDEPKDAGRVYYEYKETREMDKIQRLVEEGT